VGLFTTALRINIYFSDCSDEVPTVRKIGNAKKRLLEDDSDSDVEPETPPTPSTSTQALASKKTTKRNINNSYIIKLAFYRAIKIVQ